MNNAIFKHNCDEETAGLPIGSDELHSDGQAVETLMI